MLLFSPTAAHAQDCIGPEASTPFRIATVVQECYEEPVSIADATVTEGNASTEIQFVVTRAGPNATPAAISYQTSDGTASASNDYVAASGTLNFGSGQSATQVIRVTVLGDTVVEGTETFVVRLSGPPMAVLRDARATGTINNDDAAPAPAPPAPAPLAPGPVAPPPAASPRPRASTTPGPSPTTSPSPSATPVVIAEPLPSIEVTESPWRTPEPPEPPVSDSDGGGGLGVPLGISLAVLALVGIGGLAFIRFRKTP